MFCTCQFTINYSTVIAVLGKLTEGLLKKISALKKNVEDTEVF